MKISSSSRGSRRIARSGNSNSSGRGNRAARGDPRSVNLRNGARAPATASGGCFNRNLILLVGHLLCGQPSYQNRCACRNSVDCARSRESQAGIRGQVVARGSCAARIFQNINCRRPAGIRDYETRTRRIGRDDKRRSARHRLLARRKWIVLKNTPTSSLSWEPVYRSFENLWASSDKFRAILIHARPMPKESDF